MDKKEDVWEFEKLEQQLFSFVEEISELSHKKPNDAVNKFKLKFINTTLVKFNVILKDYRPFDDFEQFDVDALPSNSDVGLILSQYAGAALRLRTEHTVNLLGDWFWIIRGKTSDVKTKRPENFKQHRK